MGIEGGERFGRPESERRRLSRQMGEQHAHLELEGLTDEELERLARQTHGQGNERAAHLRHEIQRRERERAGWEFGGIRIEGGGEWGQGQAGRQAEGIRMEARREYVASQSALLTERFRDGLDRIEAARHVSAEELRHETVFQELRERCTGILTDVDLCLQDAEFWLGLKDGWAQIHQLTDDLTGRLEPFLWIGLPPLLEAVGYRTPPPPPIMEVVTGMVESIANAVQHPGDEVAAAKRIDEVHKQLIVFTHRARLQLDWPRPETPEEVGRIRRGVEEVARVGRKVGGPIAIAAAGTALDSFVPGAGSVVDVAVQRIAEYPAGLAACALTETDPLNGPAAEVTHPGAGQTRDWAKVHRAALFVALHQAGEAGERMAQALTVTSAAALSARQDSWNDHRVAIDAVSLHLGELRQLLPGERSSQRLQESIGRLDSMLDDQAQRVSADSPRYVRPHSLGAERLLKDLDVHRLVDEAETMSALISDAGWSPIP